MDNNAEPTKRWFEDIDPKLPDIERYRLLKEAKDRFEAAHPTGRYDIEFSDKDEESLYQWAKDPNSHVRALAVEVLCDTGYFDLDDIEIWILDPFKRVRDPALYRMMLIRYGEYPIEWFIQLLSKAIDRYADWTAGGLLASLSDKSEEWLDLTWAAVDKLFNCDNPEIISMLTIAYVENVLHYGRNLEPGDPRIKAWIEHGDLKRKRALLEVTDYIDYRSEKKGNLLRITEALANDPDNRVAAAAKGILQGMSLYDCEEFMALFNE